MESRRKQIVFDIDTKVAEEILGANYRNIYKKIEKYMYKNGFNHIQGTVYESKEPKSYMSINKLLKKMKELYPSLDKCIRDIRQTDITNIHSLNKIFNYDGTSGNYKQQKTIKIKTR